MVRKKQHNDGLVDGNIHSKKRPSTTKFQYPFYVFTIQQESVLVNQKIRINIEKCVDRPTKQCYYKPINQYRNKK
ncbi:hypothetical protein WMO42_02420 [Lachnospira sp. CLA-JM-H23]